METPMPPTAPATPATLAPRPRRRVSAWTILLVFLLLFSLAANFVLFVLVGVMGLSLGNTGPSSNVETETLRNGGHDKVAILPLEGEVGDDMVQSTNAFCDYVKEHDDIKAVVLEIESPGGSVTASDEIHHMLSDLHATNRRITVSMRGLAASGGYYIAMPADKIYAEPTTLTGSIGVIWPAFEVSEMMKKIGVTTDFIKSDNANEYKDAGSPFKPFTPQDEAYIKNLVNQMHTKFADVVSTGRKGKLKQPINTIAIGKIWTADEALSLGLIDEIAYPDEVYLKTASDAGIANPTVVRLRRKTGLLGALGASAPFGSNHVTVQLDPHTLQSAAPKGMEFRVPGLR
jgi:protease-4